MHVLIGAIADDQRDAASLVRHSGRLRRQRGQPLPRDLTRQPGFEIVVRRQRKGGGPIVGARLDQIVLLLG